MIRIFTDQEYVPKGQRWLELFNAFWGPFSHKEIRKGHSLWRKQFSTLDSFISLTDNIHKADIAVLPADWKRYERTGQEQLAVRFADLIGERRPLVVFYHDDSQQKIPIEKSFVFRTSLSRSKKRQREFAMPAWHTDYVEEYFENQLQIRKKRSVPIIGFCGHATHQEKSVFQKTKRYILDLIRGYSSQSINYLNLRLKIIGILENSPQVKTDFILRDQYQGGSRTTPRLNLDQLLHVRREFVDNIIQTDYTLCMRGAGNYSFRFYETLCCGRIPLFIDTDCVLPFEQIVDWEKYLVWMPWEKIEVVATELLNFHSALSSEGFIRLQQDCRKLWEQWLSPRGFFSNFVKCIDGEVR